MKRLEKLQKKSHRNVQFVTVACGEDGRVAESTQNDLKGRSDGREAGGGCYGLVFGF